ncbi:hypothetical protein Tco_0509075 [Tanacetum coccineum]
MPWSRMPANTEYLLEFTSEYGIPKSLHPELPGLEDTIMDFPEGKVGVYTNFFEFANFYMDLFNLISTPNPSKVRTGTRPRAAHKVLLLTATANHVIEMEDTVVVSGSSWTPAAIEKSPLDFADENPPLVITERCDIATTNVILEASLEKEVIAMWPVVNKRRRKRGNEGTKANTPPNVLRKDHVASRPLSSKKVPAAEDPDSEKSTSFTSMAQVTAEERIKAAFEEFKKYEDDKLDKRCAEMDARLDALSIDVDEELQAFANVVSAGIAKGMSEGLEYSVKQGEAKLDLAAIEAYDPDVDDKYVAALHTLKDLKYPLSDTREDAPQWIRKLRPSSSQLTIPVYPEVHDPKDHWAYKEEMLLGDAIAENISRAEKKKKCRVVYRTHRVGSAHHARSNGVPVSAPTVAPQVLAILLADMATQTEDEVSLRLIRSKSLPPMYNLDWP